MRGFALGLVLALVPVAWPQAAKKPTITVRNESNRPVEVAVSVRQGKEEVAIGRPILLPVKSGTRSVPGLFGPVREGAHYTVTIADAKHRRLGLFRLDSRLVRTAQRRGMRLAVNNQAVNVSVGSRRQRFLLLP